MGSNRSIASLVLALCSIFYFTSAGAQGLIPRTPLPKQSVFLGAISGQDYTVTVKFADHALVRINPATQQVSASTQPIVSEISSVLSSYGLSFNSPFGECYTDIPSILAEAEMRSGREQPDLFGLYRLTFSSTDQTQRQNAVNALLALNSVEFVGLNRPVVPPTTSLLPDFGSERRVSVVLPESCTSYTGTATPWLEHCQTYFDDAYGINVNYAHAQELLMGEGMKYADVEYCWLPNHEDHQVPRLTFETLDWDPDMMDDQCWHGSAVTGMLSANRYNSFGIQGMTPAAAPYAHPRRTGQGTDSVERTHDALCTAIQATNAGDIIMLEVQSKWPVEVQPPPPKTPFGPAEFVVDTWLVSQVATDAGRIVVAAAGNGDIDLDHGRYANYRAWGDCGAIIVGASLPDNRRKHSFSTYGSKVTLHGWGEQVATLGYGDLYLGNNDYDRSYTKDFRGTSSATPMVAAAAILTQQKAKQVFGTPLDAFEMRELLRVTGKPQLVGGNFNGHIGPLPDLQGSLSKINEADARITASTIGSNTIRLAINNLGPSRAAGRTVTVQLMAGGAHTFAYRTDTSGVSCQLAEEDEDLSCVIGVCDILECELPETRFGQAPIILEWACENPYSSYGIGITAILDSGGQTDPGAANNEVYRTATCGPITAQ